MRAQPGDAAPLWEICAGVGMRGPLACFRRCAGNGLRQDLMPFGQEIAAIVQQGISDVNRNASARFSRAGFTAS
jgi:hypothetical protein